MNPTPSQQAAYNVVQGLETLDWDQASEVLWAMVGYLQSEGFDDNTIRSSVEHALSPPSKAFVKFKALDFTPAEDRYAASFEASEWGDLADEPAILKVAESKPGKPSKSKEESLPLFDIKPVPVPPKPGKPQPRNASQTAFRF